MFNFIRGRNKNDVGKKKGGFTLIELMAIIIVLSLIIIIVVGIVNGVIDNSKDKMDDATKKFIVSVAESYAMEYRGEDTWHEEIDEDGNISFCVSLNSLINYGYFTNHGSNFDDYRNKYAVKFDIVNGVTTSSFIDLDDVDNGVCKYYVEDSKIIDNKSDKVDVVDDDGNKIGDFSYDIIKIDNNRYDLEIDLIIKDYLVSTSSEHAPIDVIYVFDNSKSMEMGSNKYKEAQNAVKNSSKTIIDKNNKSEVGLVLFSEHSKVAREFESKYIDGPYENTKMSTNIAKGLDAATALLYKSYKSGKDLDNTYVILLSDGDSNTSSYVKLEKNNLNSTELYKKYNNYNINGNQLAEKYFESFLEMQKVVNSNKNSNEISIELNHSSNYLKNLGAKFFIIGYEFVANDGLKKLATQNNDLCISGEGFSAYSNHGNNYCYYDCSSANMIGNLFEKLLQNIVEYSSKFDKLNLVVESKVNVSGSSLVTFVKDGVELEGNKIIEKIESFDVNTNKEIKLDGNYSFKLNSVVYDMCSTDNDDINQCNLNSVQLFDAYIEFVYSDGSQIAIPVVAPSFEVSVSMMDKLN